MSKARRGFTLTEIAIVLGIIGLILGAIWVSSAQVSHDYKLQKSVKQDLSILSAYRMLYTTNAMPAGNGTDVTCDGVNVGIFPADMLPGLPCDPANVAPLPISVWGNYGTIRIKTYNSVSYSPSVISIIYTNLTSTDCAMVVGSLGSQADVLYEGISSGSVSVSQNLPPQYGSAGNVPWTMTQITQYCTAAGPQANVEIGFTGGI